MSVNYEEAGSEGSVAAEEHLMARRGLWLVLAMLVFPVSAGAQTALADLIPQLVLDTIETAGGPTGAAGVPHNGHFNLLNPRIGSSQAASIPNAPTIQAVAAFNGRLAAQAATFPLGSSAGGFTWVFDPIASTYTRAAGSFGPSFAERAATIGTRKLGIGVDYQHTSFDNFAGQKLGDGSITFYLPHNDCCGAPPSVGNPTFEDDLAEASLHLRATMDTFAVFAQYGLSNRLDVAVVIPVNRVDLQADMHVTLIRLSTCAGQIEAGTARCLAGQPLLHTFVQGVDAPTKDYSSGGTASGLGDIVLRSKYRFYSAGATGLAAAIDLRLPTGDAANLLGAGTTQAKVYLIASGGGPRFEPHVNAGYTFSGKGFVSSLIPSAIAQAGATNEADYAAGIDVAATPRVTLIGDLIGRTLIDAGKVESQTRTFVYSPGASPLVQVASNVNPVTGTNYVEPGVVPGSPNLFWGTVGAKVNVAPNLLVSGGLLFPLNHTGLTGKVTYSLGLDYAF
jgi:hypothetical protein